MSEPRLNPFTQQQRGMTGSGEHLKKFGANGDIGAGGENFYARSLISFCNAIQQEYGSEHRYRVFHGMKVPAKHSPGRQGPPITIDVDFVIASGLNLVLVDSKRWAAGVYYWSLFGIPMKNLWPLMHNDRLLPSQSGAMAIEGYRRHFADANVSSMYAFVPTDNGESPASVEYLRLPGGGHAYLAAESFREIHRRLGRPAEPEPSILVRLLALQM